MVRNINPELIKKLREIADDEVTADVLQELLEKTFEDPNYPRLKSEFRKIIEENVDWCWSK